MIDYNLKKALYVMDKVTNNYEKYENELILNIAHIKWYNQQYFLNERTHF